MINTTGASTIIRSVQAESDMVASIKHVRRCGFSKRIALEEDRYAFRPNAVIKPISERKNTIF